MNLLDTLLNIPTAGIVALLNESDKKVQVLYSSNLRAYTMGLVNNIENGSYRPIEVIQDGLNVDLVVLDSVQNRKLLKHRAKELERWYVSQGYALYKALQNVTYNSRIIVKYDHKGIPKAFVEVINSRRQIVWNKAFVTLKEANMYLESTSIESMLREASC